ncbi:hypothetical protein [Trichlorobacter ammonificans]|uniref:DUF4440 domain-containing protein n=1 Tax=Trichlorobacter ammonificans TaxID=2916410 RepID=A0ABN8HH43_9BACT|nr:hypothetical protein [Trichlorobacter ammonificans]CAH2032149.1 conserved exported protein of unknown function [Trichlorobacter ammonificans]
MFRPVILLFFLVCCLVFPFPAASAAATPLDPREEAMAATLDVWRDGRFEQLYDLLSHRSGMTRERFVRLLRETDIRPACCFTKLRDFRVVNEKRTTAKVFARVGMEGGSSAENSHSREFTLDHEEGRWKMRLSDIKSLAGGTGSKRKR